MAYLFTIEQIELVRRLRKTGMTKEQVWRAYEEMDRLDAEINITDNNCHNFSTINANMNANSAAKTCNNNQVNSVNSHPFVSVNSNTEHNVNKNTVCLPLTKTSQSNNINQSDRSTNSLPPITQSFNLSNLSPHELSDEDSMKESVTITPIISSSQEVPPKTNNIIATISKPAISIYYHNEEPPELVEFKKRGDVVMLNEIRAFVNKYNIRQIMIAEMTKISQGYVSRFFRGEGQDMSERSKNLIYLWYLTCRHRPEILTQFCPQTIGERRTQLTEAGDMLPIRRDRFIFRREHLIVLDKYFKENPYPDASSKEMIADECNAAIERIAKRSLKERDKVTVSIVSNWFNNKRKEAKNKKNSHENVIQAYNQCELPSHLSPLQSSHHFQALPYHTENHLYSNHSNHSVNSVEELETRPDISMLTDFDNHNSIGLSDEDSQQSFSIEQTNFSPKQMKPSFSIKLEPMY